AVVDDRDAVVRMKLDPDRVAEARDRLVDRVVHDFVDEVMEPSLTGRSDVHAGALANRLETLEHGDVCGRVARGRRLVLLLCLFRAARGAAAVAVRSLTRPVLWQQNPPKACLSGCRSIRHARLRESDLRVSPEHPKRSYHGSR